MGQIVAVLPAFLLACVAVAALPGPSTALFLHRTVRDGRKAGLAAVAGNEIGVFCWALAAGAGLTPGDSPEARPAAPSGIQQERLISHPL
jgi:threonine/homoserine/homoserine lactone efflux protein